MQLRIKIMKKSTVAISSLLFTFAAIFANAADNTYYMWKGAESGPYSVAEIRDMLSRGRIGLLHKIGTKDSAFVTLKDVDLDALEQSDARTANAPSDILALASYAVAGIAFLSPWTLAASAAIAAYLWAAGARRPAVLSAALSAAFALLGILFFDIFYPTLEG